LTYVEETGIENIIQNADIISLHLPLNPETKHFVNTEFIEAVARPFILINTSRGNCIDTKALLSGLEKGKITGACLDVFENEKTPTFTAEEHKMYEQLYEYPQVILSPHVAGWTVESKEKLAATLLRKIKAALKH